MLAGDKEKAMFHFNEDFKRKNRNRDDSLNRIILKNSISSLGNAICIDHITNKKVVLSPSRLEMPRPPSIQLQKEVDFDSEKGNEHEDGRLKSKIYEDKSPYSYKQQNRNLGIKVTSHGRNVSAIWRSKRPSSKQSSTRTKQKHSEKTAQSFSFKKKQKSSGIQLKFQIRKYESIPRYTSEQNANATVKFRKKTLKNFQLPHNHVTSFLDRQNMMNKYSALKPIPSDSISPIRLNFNHQRSTKSSLWPQSKNKKLEKKNEKLWMRHCKQILKNPLQCNEESIQVVKKDSVFKSILEHQSEIKQCDLKEISASCFQICYFKGSEMSTRMIISKEPHKKVEIASITKIMTCFLIIKIAKLFNIEIKTEKALVSEMASKMPGTSAKLQYSQTPTIYELLHALMLPSGNDAAVVLGEWGGKTIRRFCGICSKHLQEQKERATKPLNFVSEFLVQKKSCLRLFIYHMNKTAKSLNLNNTYFVNTHGLMNSFAYSTAHDVSLLTCIAMRDKFFREIVGKKQFECKIHNRTYSHSRTVKWVNTNKILQYEGFIGVKTGITPAAGPCLSSVFEIGRGQQIAIVVLKVKDMGSRFKETLSLLKMALKITHPMEIDKLLKPLSLDLMSKKDEENGNQEQANMDPLNEPAEGCDEDSQQFQ